MLARSAIFCCTPAHHEIVHIPRGIGESLVPRSVDCKYMKCRRSSNHRCSHRLAFAWLLAASLSSPSAVRVGAFTTLYAGQSHQRAHRHHPSAATAEVVSAAAPTTVDEGGTLCIKFSCGEGLKHLQATEGLVFPVVTFFSALSCKSKVHNGHIERAKAETKTRHCPLG